jgi:hypothetical protein
MSYTIHYNHSKNQLEVTTPYCILDSASLVTPVQFQSEGKGQGEPRHSIRALFDLSFKGAQDFLKELREECRNLVDNVEQFHPAFAPENAPINQIVSDCVKIGKEIIAEKKAQDERAERKAKTTKAPLPSKKAYNPAMDYLDGLFYFYARASSKFPPRVFDRDNQLLTPSSDDFFAPSFKGKLKLVIKRAPAFGSKDPDVGGSLVAYMNSVQFIRSTPEIDYRRALAGFDKVDSDDEAECMFNIPKKKAVEDDVLIFGASKKTATKPTAQRKVNDDIDEYTENF